MWDWPLARVKESGRKVESFYVAKDGGHSLSFPHFNFLWLQFETEGWRWLGSHLLLWAILTDGRVSNWRRKPISFRMILTVLKPGMGLSLLVLTVAAKKPKDYEARDHVLGWRTNGSRGLGVRIERVCSWHPNPIAISCFPH